MADDVTQQAPETPAGTEGAGEQGGFSEAFAERASQANAADKPPETPAAAPAAAPEGKPAEEAGQTQAPSPEAAAPVAEPKAPVAFDPYAGLTPEQKSHFEKLAASERSNRGRVGALTKKLNGFTGTQAPPEKTEGRSETEDAGAEGKTPEASSIEARLKTVTDEYGDIVGPVAEIVQELRKEISDLKASDTRREVDRDAVALTEAYAKLEEAHPDYQQVAADPAFHGWLGKQPQGVQALVKSYDPAEVSLALQLFKTETGAKPASETVTEEGKGGSDSTATGDRRERQLDGLRQAPERAAPVAAGVPNDFSSAFAARAQQHQGQARR